MISILLGSISTTNVGWVWVLIILLLILSYVGLVLPLLPSLVFIWLAFLSYHLFIPADGLNLYFWLSMAIFTLLIVGADFYISAFFVGKFGGSSWSKWAAIIGMVAGIFIYPPLGILILPFIVVFAIELYLHHSLGKAVKIALSTVAGLLSSAMAKAILQTVMILIFFFFILF